MSGEGGGSGNSGGGGSSETRREAYLGEIVSGNREGHFRTDITDEHGNRFTGVGNTTEEAEARAKAERANSK